MKAALRVGNVALAMQSFALRKRGAYEIMFNNLTVPLSQIDQVLTGISFVKESGLNVEYDMTGRPPPSVRAAISARKVSKCSRTTRWWTVPSMAHGS
jgi:hypothetical protein